MEGVVDTKKERVVVMLATEHKVNPEAKLFAARIPTLGLTAYGGTPVEASQKLKQMFAAFVAAHRMNGTLVATLKHSQLTWCWESEYEGLVEAVTPEGKSEIQSLKCSKSGQSNWQRPGELVFA